MNKKVQILLISLTMALTLLLSGCGGSAAAPAESERTAADATQAPETTAPVSTPAESIVPESPKAAAAITDGELIYTLGSDYMVLAANGNNGWLTASWIDKGYGTEYVAINTATGQSVKGEEGAEVVLCQNAVVRFMWRDAGGTEVSPEDMYLYMGDDPKEATLYAVIYGFDGIAAEEQTLLTMTQTDDDPYYSAVYPLMEEVITALGGGAVEGNSVMLTVKDDGGDAVVSDGGREMVRIPGADANMTYAFMTDDGQFLSVCRPDTYETEIYQFDE